MEDELLKQEIDNLIVLLGDDLTTATPAAEHEVVEKIRRLLENTRDQRTTSARDIWETYLPYAAKRCYQLTRLEEGWENDLDYFSSENAQFCLDDANAQLEKGDIASVRSVLARVVDAVRLMKRDRITQVDILLHALDVAFEVSDKNRTVQLYQEVEKIYRKHLNGGGEYIGTGWLPKIKKMGRQLEQYGEKLRRYYQYAATVTVAIEADSEGDLERLIDYLQQHLAGKVTVTRRAKIDEETGAGASEPGSPRSGHFRARVKFTME